LLSDYGYGIFTPGVIDAIAKLQAQSPRPLTIDSKQLRAYRSIAPTAVKPNYQEAIQLLGLPRQTADRVDQLCPYGDRLLTLTGAAIVAVTLDVEGVLLFESGHSPYHVPTQPAPDQQASGAGDTFISTLTLALMAGATARTAAEIAVAATALVVTQPGTTCCDLNQLRSNLEKTAKTPSTPR
jgi:D-beta-D-heptose 7-phosphate kinase / D-beta-D-heptose 1-phosphate adenosyltransferase